MAFLFLVYFFRNLSVWTVNDFGSCFSLAEKQLLRAIYIARIVLVNKTPALRKSNGNQTFRSQKTFPKRLTVVSRLKI